MQVVEAPLDGIPPTVEIAPPASVSTNAEKERNEARKHREILQKLWGRTVIVGGTTGLAAPGGLVGLTAQLNPSKLWGISWGAGVGGLGTAVAVGGWLRPAVPGDEWAPTLGLGFSWNVISSEQRNLPGYLLPSAARWLNAEVASEWRVSSGRMVRLGFGHAFLLNGSAFRCRNDAGGNCDAASESNVPGWAPYGGGIVQIPDLIVENNRGRLVHMWFIHLDFGAIFSLLSGRSGYLEGWSLRMDVGSLSRWGFHLHC